jgi:putative aminopeptidase FrvX
VFFGQIAIHLRKERTEMVDVDCIYIDIGVDTKDEVTKLQC